MKQRGGPESKAGNVTETTEPEPLMLPQPELTQAMRPSEALNTSWPCSHSSAKVFLFALSAPRLCWGKKPSLMFLSVNLKRKEKMPTRGHSRPQLGFRKPMPS